CHGLMDSRDRDDHGLGDPPVVDDELADGAVWLAPAVGWRAGVEDPDAARRHVHGNVRVPEYDQVGVGESAPHPGRATVFVAAVVDHRHVQAGEGDLEGFRCTPGCDV